MMVLLLHYRAVFVYLHISSGEVFSKKGLPTVYLDWLIFLQGSWDFTERARQSIQEEDGLLAAKAAKTNFAQRGKAQSSLERPAPGLSGEVILLIPFFHCGQAITAALSMAMQACVLCSLAIGP